MKVIKNVLTISIKYDTNVKLNYCTIMPVVDTNNFNSIYNVVSKKLTTENGKKSGKKEVSSNHNP